MQHCVIKRKLPSLQEAFFENSKPSAERLRQLANELNLTFQQVYGWFTRKRRSSELPSSHLPPLEATKSAHISSANLERLEAAFNKCNYLSKRDEAKLASDLGLSVEKVQNWFVRRRARAKQNCLADISATDTSRIPTGKIAILESVFKAFEWPSPSMKRHLSKSLNLDISKVDGWFVRKRFALGIRRSLSTRNDGTVFRNKKVIVGNPEGAFYII